MMGAMKADQFTAALWGFVVGDALGVPVEFMPRHMLEASPVTDLREWGTHHQPPGTWSDDTSMTLGALEVLGDTGSLDPDQCLGAWKRWLRDAEYTPHGTVFDVGNACRSAISRYCEGVDPLRCGGTGEYDNGNGSLMRMLPAIVYASTHGFKGEELREMVDVHSSLTHAHPISTVGCLLYVHFALGLIEGLTPEQAYERIRQVDLSSYPNSALQPYSLILGGGLRDVSQGDIKSSGFVAHTLTAALWVLLTHDDYAETVLAAVNLGEDTDTTGAVAGLLAGLTYGLEAIPGRWRDQITAPALINNIADRVIARLAL